MTRKLRKRFVLFTMAAVACLLVFLVSAIGAMSWVTLARQSDRTLELLASTDGGALMQEAGRPMEPAQPVDPDILRAARFFSVRCDAAGNILGVSLDQSVRIDRETALGYARSALALGRDSGRLDGYRYTIREQGSQRLVCFLDVTQQSASFRTLLAVSAAIAAACWLLLLALVIPCSARVVRPLAAGLEKQKQFITNAGHEMKTPLAIIQSNNDTMALLHGENKYNVHIRAQTKRLNALMTNLLTLARLDEVAPLPTQTVDVSALAAELLPAWQEAALARSLRLEAQVEPRLSAQTNRDGLTQVLTVLLDNALRYTPENGEICLTLTRAGRQLRLVEENTCAERPAPDPERLFERFYRGDAARTQRGDGGFGVGLSAARAVCESFGGTLTASYPAPGRIRFVALL